MKIPSSNECLLITLAFIAGCITLLTIDDCTNNRGVFNDAALSMVRYDTVHIEKPHPHDTVIYVELSYLPINKK